MSGSPGKSAGIFGALAGSCRRWPDGWPAAPIPPVSGGRASHRARRPEKNAITQDMYRAMSDAIDTAQNNPDIPCIIITAGSGAFTVRFFRAGGRGGRGRLR